MSSKRGLYVACLRGALDTRPHDESTTDLALVSLLELAPRDNEVRGLLRDHLAREGTTPDHLGARLLARALISPQED